MFPILTYTFLWILLMGVAIFAGQNPTPVSLRFLFFRSIQLPLGLVLVFWAGFGALVATIVQVLREQDFTPPSFQPQEQKSTSYQSTYSYQYGSSRRSQDDWDEEDDDDWID